MAMVGGDGNSVQVNSDSSSQLARSEDWHCICTHRMNRVNCDNMAMPWWEHYKHWRWY